MEEKYPELGNLMPRDVVSREEEAVMADPACSGVVWLDMRGLGRSVAPMLVALMGSCVFRIVWIYTVFAAFPSMFVLYLSYPISWSVTAAVHYTMCIMTLRRQWRENETNEKKEKQDDRVQNRA